MKKFKEFIVESGLHVFDIDDTLLKTAAKIKVMKGDKHVDSLSSSQYNDHKLPRGHHYDFSEFHSAETFSKGEPVDKMMNKLKAIHKNVKAKPNSKVILATARPDLDSKEGVLNTFRKHGVDIDNIHIHRSGNLPGEGSVAEKKAQTIHNELNKGKYTHATLYDDNKENLNHFLGLQKHHPDKKFKAYHVHDDGSIKRHRNDENNT